MELRDTAGQHKWDDFRKRELARLTPDVVLICFAINNRNSFINVGKRWIPEFEKCFPYCPFLLVGTKSDLRVDVPEEDLITMEQAAKFAGKWNTQYIECSARSNEGVTFLFDQVQYFFFY